MKQLRKAGVLFLGLASTFLLGPGLEAQLETEPGGREALYSFVDSLSQAQALRDTELGLLEGTWFNERFEFEGLHGAYDVQVFRKVAVEGKFRRAIHVLSLPEQDSLLIFSDVPPGRNLRLFFALPDSVFEKGIVAPVQVEAWIGGKRLFTTATNARGWQEKTLDLSLPLLLQRPYRVTVKVRATGVRSTPFLFYGHIE